MKKRPCVGVLIGNTHTNHPKGLINSICSSAKEMDMDVIFFLATQSGAFYEEMMDGNTAKFDYQYNTIYNYARMSGVDVLIVAYGSLCIFFKKETRISFMKKFEGIPYVILEDEAVDDQGCGIIADNYGGMRMVMEHLLDERQLEQIAFLSGPMNNKDARERLTAYKDTMREHGIPVTDEMIAYGNYSEFVSVQTEQLLKDNPGVEAIVCANDEMARCVYRVCEKHGLQVGRDIMVTGFDNIDVAKYLNPPLTTVYQNSWVMGRIAMEKVKAICEGKKPESCRMPVDFIVRASSGSSYDLLSDTRETSSALMERISSLTSFEHRAWFAPFLLRDLMLENTNEERFYRKLGRILHKLGAGSSYLYLCNRPIIYREEGEWKNPKYMEQAMKQEGAAVTAYPVEKRPRITSGVEFRNTVDTENQHIFMNFLLFAGDRQYGILTCEIEPEEIGYYFMVTLQIGTAIRYLEMEKKVKTAYEKLTEKNSILNFLAVKDPMTEIFNRRGFVEYWMKFNKEHGGKKALMILADLDHLKEINDTFGHTSGDSALIRAARVLEGIAADRDGAAGRIGGDEFAMLLAVEGDAEDYRQRITEEIRGSFEMFNSRSSEAFYVEMSVGAVVFECGEEMDFQKLVSQADERLYLVKKHRRASIRKQLCSK